jgi:hypothetical protein
VCLPQHLHSRPIIIITTVVTTVIITLNFL